MTTLVQLEQEIDRIVSSPYSVSLKKLDDILSQTDGLVVCDWAYGHPCQIQRLASAVTEGLELWPYTLRILQKLSQSETIRDAVLRQEPALLDTLLSKAISSSRDGNEYSSACVALLSEPLPLEMALPASAQTFFLKTFDAAVRSPSNENMGRVYALLDGACSELLGLLPQGTLNRFEEHLERVMRDFKGVEEGSPFVLCLWIMKALAGPFSWSVPSTFPPSGNVPTSSPRPVSPTWRSDAARSFFTGSKAAKTMLVLTLRVVLVFKEGTDMPLHRALENVKAANEAVQAVDVVARHEWSRANSPYIRKLIEKAMRHDIHPDLRLQTLTFVGLISNVDHISAQLITAYEKLLIACDRFSANPRHLSTAFSTSLHTFSSRISEGFCRSVLHRLLLAVVKPGSTSIHRLRVLHMLVVELTRSSQGVTAVRQGLLHALSAEELQEAINQFIELSPGDMNPTASCEAGCPHAIENARRQLGVATCSILLKSALAAQADEAGISTPLAMALFDKQQSFAAQSHVCRHSSINTGRAPAVAIFQEECTPDEELRSHDWRDRLATGLSMESKLKNEFIIRAVGQVCRDLEERCAKAEEPFREEQARHKELQVRYDELSTHASDLEAQAVDRDLVLEAMEVEKTQVEAHLRTVELENDELLERVEELQRLLKEANEEAERSLNAVRLDFDRNIIELQAARASKDEALQAERAERHTMEQELHDMKSEVQRAKQEIKQLQSVHTTLQDDIERLRHDLDTESACRAEKESEICTLIDKQNVLKKELEARQVELERFQSRSEALESEQENLLRSTEEQLDSLKALHQSELQNAATQAAEIQASLRAQLNHNNEELVQVKKSHDVVLSKLQERQLSLAHMQKKVEHLQRACTEKDLEITQLAKMRQMMTTALGLADNPMNFAMKLDTTRDPVNVHPKTPGRSRKNRRSSEVPMNAQAEEREETEDAALSVNHSFESSTSSRNGPTPKRTKPRKSFKVPTIQQPRLSAGAVTSRSPQKGGSVLRRPPLTDVSLGRGNTSPARRNFAVMGKVDKPGLPPKHLQECEPEQPAEIEDVSFDASGIFTSTPATPPAARPQNSQRIYDETTADF